MKIISLQSSNSHTNLNINKISFDNFTLLVGASGVGKTQILKAINNIKAIANGESKSGFHWDISFTSNDNNSYRWTGNFEALPSYDEYLYTSPFLFSLDDEKVKAKIERECIYLNESIIVDRSHDDIFYNGTKTVRLSLTESVVSLLKEEEYISEIKKAFNNIVRVDSDDGWLTNRRGFDVEENTDLSVDEIREKKASPVTKLYFCQRYQPDFFKSIVDSYKDIFPYVDDVRVDEYVDEGAPRAYASSFVIKVKERGIDSWILQSSMSSGMLKTLLQIAYLKLSPSGTVF